MTDGLAALFTATGIGSGNKHVNPDVPQTSDPAWKSYRLKGTQTTFYNTDGYPTIVGASITEGGFVNSASCMSCHVQASVNKQGQLGVPGVGATGRLNLSGLGTVVNGHPVNADYFDRGTTNQRAVRVDFVWGSCLRSDRSALCGGPASEQEGSQTGTAWAKALLSPILRLLE